MAETSAKRGKAQPGGPLAPGPGGEHFTARRIVAAARRRFYALGFRRVTMDDLAEELGMSKKTLYEHFPGKKALVEAMVLNKLQEVEADLDRIVSDRSSDFFPLFSRLLAAMQAHMEEVQPPFLQDLRHEPELFNLIESRRGEIIQRFFGRVLGEGQKKGVIREDIPAPLIMEIVLGAVRTIINPAKMAELDITPKTGMTAILRIILEGVVTEEGRLSK